MNSAIRNSELFIYEGDYADHFLAFKNPTQFTQDLIGFIDNKEK
jgi:hypothetical protein